MSQTRSETVSVVLGAITATGLGTFLFQALGTLVLGFLGALGGYLFSHFLKPRLDRLLAKKKQEKAG